MKTEIIQALLNGKTVQLNIFDEDNNGSWVDLNTTDYSEFYASLFSDDNYPRWRIKPEIISISVRLALMRSSEKIFYTETVNSIDSSIELIKYSDYFIKWLTDWVIYEI